ncbi:porin [Labrys miyagiensis]|uniref:Porin n=1 Tax=Labrys miyagiensis TaxID=346912 RepID=A0ABQ6CHS6_9HYPH|nr:porin [Labrys miyagiensis]GLS19715.1 porin [Labrys miyagiensis]
MTMKSLLLGAAAGIAAIGAAQAADLPMTKGEAVEYVKVCTTFGPGFFYIPGSDTCLQIKGEVRADYRVRGISGSERLETIVDGGAGVITRNSLNLTRDQDRTRFGAEGRIAFDARTQTDYGLLRSYFQINADGMNAAGKTQQFTVDKAFIQFGGLTAGYAHTFFGYYDANYGDTIWAPYYASSNTVNLLAYTAEFGGGFSATLALEDGRGHRVVGPNALGYGGQVSPDIVGNIVVDQGWALGQLSAAVHQDRVNEAAHLAGGDDKWGYAVGGTLLFKIPAIDSGHFIVEGAYSDGALEYLGTNSTAFGGDDFYAGPNNTRKGKGWSIVGELGGNITPVLNANLVASYIDTKYNDLPGFGGHDQFNKEFTIAGNLTYTIVKGLTLGAEIAYTHASFNQLESSTTDATTEETTTVFHKGHENIWEAGIRLKRTF